MGLKELINSNERRLILFGGKGGVGKTSIAASAAVYAAEKGKKTLIISSDPAHSLSDVFEQEHLASGQIEKIEGIKNLYALEVSPKEVLGDYQHYLDEYPEYKIIMGETLENFPGSNEGFGLLNIIRMYRYEDYDHIIVDTAPTGHTLRLLSFPDFLKSSMMRFIKIRHALGSLFGKLTGFFRRKKKSETAEKDPVELLEKMKTWAIEAREWLTKGETCFIIIMIPELLSIYETQRLVTELEHYNIQIGGLYINKIFPDETDCEFCLAKRRTQDQSLQIIQDQFVEFSPKTIPFLSTEVHGLDILRSLSQLMFKMK
ncbi:MAG: ArsA family ATPase [Candidatus Helarchaeota archaeon]|nr:ArsA family ATPase [Candidatus Helarchaeota archaeon]